MTPLLLILLLILLPFLLPLIFVIIFLFFRSEVIIIACKIKI